MGASLSFGWGMPTTNACTMSGCDMRNASISPGATMKWLILNVSRSRPLKRVWPSPAWMERAGLRGEHGRPLEVHAGEIRDEIGIALQESVETAGRTFAAVGEDDRGLSMSGQGPVQGRLRRVGQLVVDDDRHAEFPRDVEDLAEGGAVGVAIDRPATDLTQVNLADHPWPATFQLELELARGGPGGRIGQGQAGDHAIGVLLARRRQPDRVVFLQTADAQEHHPDDVVPLHRRDVRVDRGRVRYVRVGVDQRSAIIGAPRRDRGEQHAEAYEESYEEARTGPVRRGVRWGSKGPVPGTRRREWSARVEPRRTGAAKAGRVVRSTPTAPHAAPDQHQI